MMFSYHFNIIDSTIKDMKQNIYRERSPSIISVAHTPVIGETENAVNSRLY